MTITVKFFASLKEQFSAEPLDIVYQSDEMTVGQVWMQVSQTQKMPENVLSAINLEFSGATDVVKDGDEVAFFPPVTGG